MMFNNYVKAFAKYANIKERPAGRSFCVVIQPSGASLEAPLGLFLCKILTAGGTVPHTENMYALAAVGTAQENQAEDSVKS